MTQSLKGEPTLKGYRYTVVVDQFPITDKVVDVHSVHSAHVETVVLLNNKNSKTKSYVEIGVDADDYYRIKEGKN